MTKAELIEMVHEQAGEGLSRKTTVDVIEAVFTAVTKSLIDDGRFSAPGFGTFTVKDRKARKGRNPRTGAEIDIPASRTVGFKVAAGLKTAL
jgi:DNA-binding protein HU-beta